MRSSLSRVASTLVLTLQVAACAPAPSPTPITTPPPFGPPALPSLATTPSANSANTAPGTWTAAASRAAADGSVAALLRDGRVLAVGSDGSAELYDPGTGRWTATGSMATARAAFTATLLLDGGVLVAGGYSDGWLASAELYDPGTGRWTATGSMAAARGGHTATLLPDGRVLVIGGSSGPDGSYATLASAELYDPGTGRWTATGSMAAARGGHTATLLPDGNVLVAGGTSNGSSLDAPMLASAELYDSSHGRWTGTGSMAEARATHTATLLPDGRVLVAGGRYAARATDGLASAELYDPSSGRWTATGSMAETRQNGHAATLLTDGRVLVVGDDHTRSVELYDPNSGRWHVAASTPVAPNGTATLLLDGTVLVVSGNFAQLFDPRGRPSPASVTIPLRGSAREAGLGILMAPGPDDTLYVSIPNPSGSVVAFLDGSGRPRPGWPVAVNAWTPCGLLLPVDDGSVRVVCNATDLPRPGNDAADLRAFSFDPAGRSMAGWPVQLQPRYPPGYTGSVIGEGLTVIEGQWLTDTSNTGRVSREAWVTIVTANGAFRSGTPAPLVENYDEWTVGPDGIGYGIALVSGWAEGSAEVSQITALDISGVREGWPVKIDGIASGPAIGRGGRIVLTVGSFVRDTSRVLVVDRDGKVVSAELPIATAESGIDCVPGMQAPLVSQDGTIFVFSEIDTQIFAIDPSLAILRGWPYRPGTPLERPDPWRAEEGINCTSPAAPAAGPDNTLYLPLQARDSTVGGSLVAVGPDGKVRAGWPVELKRPGAEFWSVVVGSDGTVYALAIEPESNGGSSASILAIAPDSTVLYTTTIIDA